MNAEPFSGETESLSQPELLVDAEAAMQMKRCMATFGHVLTIPEAQISKQRHSHLSASIPLRAAQDYQRGVAKDIGRSSNTATAFKKTPRSQS